LGLIFKDLVFVGRKGRRTLRTLFDTGSVHCFMRQDLAEALDYPDELSEPKHYESVVGSFTARPFVVADIELRKKRLTQLFKVVPHLTEDAILGVDFMQVWQIKLDPHTHRIHFSPKACRLIAVGSRPKRRR